MILKLLLFTSLFLFLFIFKKQEEIVDIPILFPIIIFIYTFLSKTSILKFTYLIATLAVFFIPKYKLNKLGKYLFLLLFSLYILLFPQTTHAGIIEILSLFAFIPEVFLVSLTLSFLFKSYIAFFISILSFTFSLKKSFCYKCLIIVILALVSVISINYFSSYISIKTRIISNIYPILLNKHIVVGNGLASYLKKALIHWKALAKKLNLEKGVPFICHSNIAFFYYEGGLILLSIIVFSIFKLFKNKIFVFNLLLLSFISFPLFIPELLILIAVFNKEVGLSFKQIKPTKYFKLLLFILALILLINCIRPTFSYWYNYAKFLKYHTDKKISNFFKTRIKSIANF